MSKSQFASIISGELKGGGSVSTQQTKPTDINKDGQEQSLDMSGLEHIFKLTGQELSEDEEDGRVRQAREKRIRKQVLEVVQKAHEEAAATNAAHEIGYLQRRVIALLTKLQELTEENSLLKQITLTQLYSLQQIPLLERELQELKSIRCEKIQLLPKGAF